jgi:P4 family phage/plasmid primase-like protien
MKINKAEIERAYRLLFAQGQVVELRALKATIEHGSSYPATYGGYFNNVEALLTALRRVQSAKGVYVTLQVCNPDLLHRTYNELVKQDSGMATSDKDILCYRWLLIDSDPNRSVSDISSTEREHADALAHSRMIAEDLARRGWPAPIVADSGNGGHLLYRIDLPVSDKPLVERTLKGLASLYDTPGVHVDQTVFNPARICKLYGTLACKGADTPERPHRGARLRDIPESQESVPKELLDTIAQPLRTDSPVKLPDGIKEGFTAEAFIQRHAIETYGPQPYEDGTRWNLKACVWDPSHTDSSACIYQFADGRLGASCSHNGCKGKGWREFRMAFEPDAYSKPSTKTSGDLWLASYDADDAGNGDAVFTLYGQDFLWCSSRGWFVWSGTHWQLDIDGCAVKRRTVETLRRRRHAAVDAGREAVITATKADDKRVNGAVNRFKTLVSVAIEEFDRNPDLLNCKSGVVDLRTGELAPHDRKQRFTYCVGVPYGEADYTEWLEYLEGVIGGGYEVVDYLQMLCGYSLTGHTREEILIYLHGPTRSGKGTFAETFMALLPDPLATMVDFNSFTAKREGDVSNFDLAPLKPARMIFASESQRDQSLNPAKIKQLTGGDQIRACFKHRDFFSYRPQFKVWMLSNHPCNGDPEDDALWGRVRVIEFPKSFLGVEDKSKKERLRDPDVLQGVLWWAVQGAMRWHELGPKGLLTPEIVAKTTQEHRDELDYVGAWLDECGNDQTDGWTPNEIVTASYTGWCKNNNIQYLKGPKALAQSLKAKGYSPGVVKWINGKAKRGVAGLYIFDE